MPPTHDTSKTASPWALGHTTRSGKLSAETVPVADLSGAVRDDMWRLFHRYYDAATRAQFDADLEGKQAVIILRDSVEGSVQGLSTLTVYEQQVDGLRAVVVFSGDTVVDERYWGQKALQLETLRFMVGTKLRNPLTPVYWFLISKGYKTYLLMARNTPTHYPRYDQPTPPSVQAMIDDFARRRFGDAYDETTGLLRVDSAPLKQNVAPITLEMLADPEIRFFVERNPGHAEGDELCCVGRMDLHCFWHCGTRQLLRAVRGSR